MDEEEFRQLFLKIMNLYQISPEVATELLKKILTILKNGENQDNSS